MLRTPFSTLCQCFRRATVNTQPLGSQLWHKAPRSSGTRTCLQHCRGTATLCLWRPHLARSTWKMLSQGLATTLCVSWWSPPSPLTTHVHTSSWVTWLTASENEHTINSDSLQTGAASACQTQPLSTTSQKLKHQRSHFKDQMNAPGF